MGKIISALIILLACSLILPIISATPLSDLGYNSFFGEGEIAMVGDIDIGLVKSESTGYLVVPTGTQVISLYGTLTSLAGYESYFKDYNNFTIEGYSVNDIDVYVVSGIAYVLNVDFFGYKGSAFENNGGVITTGEVEHFTNGNWIQE